MRCPSCGKVNADEARFCGGCGIQLAPQESQQPVGNYPVEPYRPVEPVYGSPVSMDSRSPVYSQLPVTDQQPAYEQMPSPNAAQPHQQYYNMQQGAVTPRAAVLQQARLAGRDMKWYKFLIYFALFAWALSCLMQGVLLITGLYYDAIAFGLGEAFSRENVYTLFPGVQVPGIVCGIVLLVAGVLFVISRVLLSKFKWPGVALFAAGYLLAPIADLAYIIASNRILSSNTVFSDAAGGSAVVDAFYVSMLASGIVSVVAALVIVILTVVYFRRRRHFFV